MNSQELRDRMIERQLKARGITNPYVLESMRLIPRELFVPLSLHDDAYADRALPIEEGQTISQPIVVATMAQAVEPTPEKTILEVGAGSAYAAVVLAAIVDKVYAIEIQERLAEIAKQRVSDLGIENLEIIHGDGSFGLSEHAPYDGIIVSAAAEVVPERLKQQLKIGGKLVIPTGEKADHQDLLVITRVSEKEFSSESLGGVRFVPLVSH